MRVGVDDVCLGSPIINVSKRQRRYRGVNGDKVTCKGLRAALKICRCHLISSPTAGRFPDALGASL